MNTYGGKIGRCTSCGETDVDGSRDDVDFIDWGLVKHQRCPVDDQVDELVALAKRLGRELREKQMAKMSAPERETHAKRQLELKSTFPDVTDRVRAELREQLLKSDRKRK